MDKISHAQAGQLSKLAAASLRHLSGEVTALKEKNASLETEVAKYQRKERAEEIAYLMEEKGIQPEIPHNEKVANLIEEDLDVVEKAINLSAPQLKLASVHDDGTPNMAPATGDDTDGQAARNFETAMITDSGAE